MKTHKILMVTDHPALTSGYGTIGKHLALHWKEMGHDVQYIGWWSKPELEEMPFPVHQVANKNDRWGWKMFPRIIEKFRPDIVWCTGDLWMIYHIVRFKGRDSYRTIWYAPIDSEGSPSSMNTPTEKIDWLQTIRDLNHIVGQTHFCKNEIKKLARADIVTNVIYPGYDPDVFHVLPEDKRRKLKGELYGDPNCYSVLYISRNGHRKNIIGAMEAFKLANIPNSKMYFHCNLSETRGYNLPEFVQSFGLEDKVILCNLTVGQGISPEQVNYIYGASDTQILISSREGFGCTGLESAACGVPFVYTNANSFAEYAGAFGLPVKVVAKTYEPITGQVAKIPDVKQAAKRLKQLHNDFRLRGKLIEGGLKFASENTWEKQYERWDRFLDEKVDTGINVPFVSPSEIERKEYPRFTPGKELKIGVMTTWNEQCGIARYSKNLYTNIFPSPVILAPDTSKGDLEGLRAIKCWTRGPDNYKRLYQAIKDEGITVLHIQNEWGLYWRNRLKMRALIACLYESGIPVFVTHHTCPGSTDPLNEQYFTELVNWSRYSIPIMHNEFYADILEQWPEFRGHPTVIPHGCDYYDNPDGRNSVFTIISSGFAHPSKGFELVIEADKLLTFPHQTIIHTSAHPEDKSGTQQKYIDFIKKRAEGSNVRIVESYLSDTEISKMFAEAHIGVFTYGTMKCQGVSGASTTCLGAGTPVITSSTPAFHEIRQFPRGNFNPGMLADIIAQIYDNTDGNYDKLLKATEEYRKTHRWEVIGEKYTELYRDVFQRAHSEPV